MKRTIKDKDRLTPQQQQRKLVDNILENDTFFPKEVKIEDIDKEVQTKIKEDFEITSQGKKVPVLDIFSLQRFAEYMKTWEYTDDTNTIKLPFIAIVREPTKRGTNLSGTYNIPSIPKFNLWKRPIVKNGKKSVEYYQIAQPVNIDIPYTVHFYTDKQMDVNKMDTLMLHLFRSSQYYVFPNGHSMPLKMENMEDNSQLSDTGARRYYHRAYPLVLKGYLLNAKDFRKLNSLDNINIKVEPSTVKNSRECFVSEIDLDCDLCLNFEFNRKAGNSKTVRVPMDLEFYYDNQNPNNDYSYFINGQLVELPFTARKGDELIVAHAIESNKVLNIKVCGRKL